ACLWPPSRRGASGRRGTTPPALSESLRLRGWHPVTARSLALLSGAAPPAAERLWLRASAALPATPKVPEQASVLARPHMGSGRAAGLPQWQATARLVIQGKSSSIPPQTPAGGST